MADQERCQFHEVGETCPRHGPPEPREAPRPAERWCKCGRVRLRVNVPEEAATLGDGSRHSDTACAAGPAPWEWGPRPCGAPANADTHLPPCELPAGHEGYHRAVGYAWGTHPALGPLLPMPEAWAPDAAAAAPREAPPDARQVEAYPGQIDAWRAAARHWHQRAKSAEALLAARAPAAETPLIATHDAHGQVGLPAGPALPALPMTGAAAPQGVTEEMVKNAERLEDEWLDRENARKFPHGWEPREAPRPAPTCDDCGGPHRTACCRAAAPREASPLTTREERDALLATAQERPGPLGECLARLVTDVDRAEAALAAARERERALREALRAARAELENHTRTDTGAHDTGALNAIDEIDAALSEEGSPRGR